MNIQTYAAGAGVVQPEACVTFTHGAQVRAHTAAVCTAAFIRVLLWTVPFRKHRTDQKVRRLRGGNRWDANRDGRWFTWVVVGEYWQEILLPVGLGLQMHLTQTAEHLWARETNIRKRRRRWERSESAPHCTHLSFWVDRCYTRAPSLDRSDSSTPSTSPRCRSSARCRSNPRPPAGSTRLCGLQCDLGKKKTKRENVRNDFQILSFCHRM